MPWIKSLTTEVAFESAPLSVEWVLRHSNSVLSILENNQRGQRHTSMRYLLFISHCKSCTFFSRVLPSDHFKMDPMVTHTIRILNHIKRLRAAIEALQSDVVR